MKIENTRNTLSDTYFQAVKIRNQVFVKEQGIAYSLEMSSPVQEAKCVHFVIYDIKEKACGTCRLLIQEDNQSVLLQRMAILPEERKKGYAGKLIAECLDFAKEQGMKTVLLHSQLSANGLYKKFHFQEEGEIFIEAGIEHITMKINL